MKQRDWQDRTRQEAALRKAGIRTEDLPTLRRISHTLHRWFEKECGDGHGCIEREEETNQTYWLNATTGTRTPIADREGGARRRLKTLMARYPQLTPYIQTDPRGVALYLLRPGDVPKGEKLESYYSRGIGVY